jgi:hypothetical protein
MQTPRRTINIRHKGDSVEGTIKKIVLKGQYECQCDERLRAKADESTRLTYTRLRRWVGDWNTERY